MIAEPAQSLTIQQAAEVTGLSAHTLRYYERIALLDPVARAANGHRRYDKQDIERLVFLNNLRLTGMPLDQMRHYAMLHRQGEAGISERVAILAAHRETVARHIEALSAMLSVIDFKIDILSQQVR